MAGTDAPAPRALAEADIPDLMALVAEAGWNQTPEDWRMMLALGQGRGIEDGDGRVVASALTLPFGTNLGWIGMVLVTETRRKQGLATRLLQDCIAGLKAAGRVAGLDATPAGQPVYERLGFRGGVALTRWRRPAREAKAPLPTGSARPLTPDDLPRITALDAAAFGIARPALIRDICLRADPAGWIAPGGGFLLHRAGRTARQIGPLCARGLDTAIQLLDTALARFDESLLVDACDAHPELAAFLSAHGFSPERPYLRMYLGAPVPAGNPASLFAIAGPELG